VALSPVFLQIYPAYTSQQSGTRPPKIFPSHNWAEHGPQIAPCLGICASTEHKVPWASSLHPKWHVHRVSRLSTTYRILSLHFTVQKDKPPKLPLPLGDLGRYLIYGSLHPPKFTTQMASQPVHTLFQGPWLYPTDTEIMLHLYQQAACYTFITVLANYRPVKGKGSPNSINDRRLPEMIAVVGSQPAGDVSHKKLINPVVGAAITFRKACSYPRNPYDGC